MNKTALVDMPRNQWKLAWSPVRRLLQHLGSLGCGDGACLGRGKAKEHLSIPTVCTWLSLFTYLGLSFPIC